MKTYYATSDASFNIKRPHYGYAFQAGPKGGIMIRHRDTFRVTPHSPTEAELMAIGHAVNCLQSSFNIQAGDHIVVHTDCKSVMMYIRHLAQPEHQHNQRLRALARVVFGTLTIKKGVTHEIRLVSESNPYLRWCHYQSKLQHPSNDL